MASSTETFDRLQTAMEQLREASKLVNAETGALGDSPRRRRLIESARLANAAAALIEKGDSDDQLSHVERVLAEFRPRRIKYLD